MKKTHTQKHQITPTAFTMNKVKRTKKQKTKNDDDNKNNK